MSRPVDLTNLHSLTGRNRALEIELFKEFFISGEEYLKKLEANCQSQNKEVWRTTAHAFKGTALNLGANRLADLCKTAQENSDLPESNKKQVVVHIRQAFDEVVTYLKKY